MRKIICLTDYKNTFGLKWNAVPYRSGMKKELLRDYFSQHGYTVSFQNFSKLDMGNINLEDDVYLYTSSEDIGYHYKNYIEDIVYGIEQVGALVIPSYEYLRANNNKVFMEIIRRTTLSDYNSLNSTWYGAIEEVDFDHIKYPKVFKKAEGAMSQGVVLAKNKEELKTIIQSKCKTKILKEAIKDTLRSYKYKGFTRESLYRSKFILQDFISGLTCDFKILIYGQRYYIFQRPVRKNDFRASGSGNRNYIYGSSVKCPDGILDFAFNIFHKLNVPHLSLDIAFDESNFYLLEFQVLHFGTVGQTKSDGYYYKNNKNWEFKNEKENLEGVYVDAILYYLLN